MWIWIKNAKNERPIFSRLTFELVFYSNYSSINAVLNSKTVVQDNLIKILLYSEMCDQIVLHGNQRVDFYENV